MSAFHPLQVVATDGARRQKRSVGYRPICRNEPSCNMQLMRVSSPFFTAQPGGSDALYPAQKIDQ